MIQSLLGIGASVVGSQMLSNCNAQHISILHAMPGRLRLQCNEWRNTNTATLLENTLTTHPIIQHVSASPVTGSLLLEFSKSHLDKEELDEVIKLAVSQTGQAYRLQEAKALKKLKQTFHMIDGRMKQQTKGVLDINTLIIVLLLGNGIKHLGKNKAFSASLFYWAYSLFTHQKDKP